ncbi:MAG: hypothetical protein K0U16_07345 [Gammaproteobacteria bacterium]|nr:hypothetical protein [Gammaproteobacteria bacterium]
MELPEKLILSFKGTPADFTIKASVHMPGGRTVHANLGRVDAEDPESDEWGITYGSACRNDGETDGASGPYAAVGLALDNALIGSDEEEDDEDEDELDDLLEDDEEGDEEESFGRQWVPISKSPDCDVHAMEINKVPGAEGLEDFGGADGCLIRTEVWGDGDQYTASTIFVPSLSIKDLLNPHPKGHVPAPEGSQG